MAAVAANNRGIGLNGSLPWKAILFDMRRFRELTSGTAIVMGRKTWESLPRKPLDSRWNIIVSRTLPVSGYCFTDAIVVRSLSDALKVFPAVPHTIIGGTELFREALPIVSRVHLTLVRGQHEADTFFPVDPYADLIENPEWEARMYGYGPCTASPYSLTVVDLSRRQVYNH